VAVLFISTVCSRAINKYPAIKMMSMSVSISLGIKSLKKASPDAKRLFFES